MVVALAVGVLAAVRARGADRGPTTPASLRPSLTSGSASAAQLARGRWAAIPPAPIGAVDLTLWTGKELLAWAGAGRTDFSRGAAFDPATNRWRTLSPAPLAARSGAAVVWTGSQVFIWGGDTGSSGAQSDGALYSPASDRWVVLPKAPLAPVSGAPGAWTGRWVVVFGQGTGGARAGAAFQPSTGRWQAMALPTPPSGHPFGPLSAVQEGGDLLVWSAWTNWHFINKANASITAGVDLFAYDLGLGRWRAVPASNGPGVALQAEAAGSDVLVSGVPASFGPPPPNVFALYHPAGNTWTKLPAPPAAADPYYSSAEVSTGRAVFLIGTAAAQASPQGGGRPPQTFAAAYDLGRGTWTTLFPPLVPPNACGQPIWTGGKVLVMCGTSGLALTPGA